MSDNTFWLDSFGITFMSIPPTKRALGVNLPSGKMYPFDNFKEDKVWLALLGLLISLNLKKKENNKQAISIHKLIFREYTYLYKIASVPNMRSLLGTATMWWLLAQPLKPI